MIAALVQVAFGYLLGRMASRPSDEVFDEGYDEGYTDGARDAGVDVIEVKGVEVAETVEEACAAIVEVKPPSFDEAVKAQARDFLRKYRSN